MSLQGGYTRAQLMCGAAFVSTLLVAAPASAQSVQFDIPAQSLSGALDSFALQSRQPLLVTPEMTSGKVSPGVSGEIDSREALARLLAGTGLTYKVSGKTFLIVDAAAPQSGSAAGDGAGTVEALIVTAQKREEDIQDVPIAISAFSQEDLTRSQVAGGPDLVTQIPNFTFTKTNFTGYTIQIRGIGTQAISATSDPAVSVAFNNTPFIRNHFFEQEFYDLERVEVLRGPQGTLYGRNATAGVVNVISAKPKFFFEAKASGDVGTYGSSRVEAMVNLPLVEDAVAVRLAGAWTKRDGFVTNEITGNSIDGRNLWSTRLSLRFSPSSKFNANLIWEHFEEGDERLRSAKQLCHKDVVTSVGGNPVGYYDVLSKNGQSILFAGVQGLFSQGCNRNSLYAPDSFQTPNGLSLPYYKALGALNLPEALDDPYLGGLQSRDLRVIASTIDPDYRAKSDIGELQVSFDIADGLTLTSETAYSTDVIYSLEDFNRFNTAPGAWFQQRSNYQENLLLPGPVGGIFCDPQLGCSDRLVAVDTSSAKSRNFSEELRLGSNSDGPFNFSLGANFLRYDTEDKYYVFINSLTLSALRSSGAGSGPYIPGVTDNFDCLNNGAVPGDPHQVYSVGACQYIDPNPIGSLNDLGHNYFLSKNPYKLISYAVFGEAYYNITDNLKVTAGLRWTVDKKEAPRIPSELLAGQNIGYPVAEVIRQEWREPTGRLAIDWKPDLAFTDETLIYGSFAHGYKAGGANPPQFVRVYYADATLGDILTQQSETRPKTFDPEFVNAFELGTKNTLLDGRLTLNMASFYYDYTGYQISEIVDRSAFNRNFDAKIWGLELEADWRPIESLRLGFKGGYENTRIADGEKAIDLMDRANGGRPDENGISWMIVRPFPTQASSCILPTYVYLDSSITGNNSIAGGIRGVGNPGGGGPGGCEIAYVLGQDPQTGLPYVPNPTVTRHDLGLSGIYANYPISPDYPGFDPSTAPNHGEGISKDVSGNSLPNAPKFTATITGDYTTDIGHGWLATAHTDLHWQSQSWWRVFDDHPYGKLHPYFTMNLAAIFANEDAGWNVMVYAKNVTGTTAITGAFLNSDDTGLTTNVFLTEPRLMGVRVTKNWRGGSTLGSFGAPHQGPYPFTLELGGQAERLDAPNERFSPPFIANFPTGIDPSPKQDEDLDWGDARSIKLTYRPAGDWLLSLGFRTGRANRHDRAVLTGETLTTCGMSAPCEVAGSIGSQFRTDYGLSNLNEGEEYTTADFMVGKDVGLGSALGLDSSTVLAGIRYASFKSGSNVTLSGRPDWMLPPERFKYVPGHHSEFSGSMAADRNFEGAGPEVEWEASSRLFGNQDVWKVDVDWSVSGGALFGKQKTTVNGDLYGAYFKQTSRQSGNGPIDSYSMPFTSQRTQSVTAPTFGASLGVSYKLGGASIGTGYRWERYYNVIDGGVTAPKDEDRTMDGPYLKFAIGFGG